LSLEKQPIKALNNYEFFSFNNDYRNSTEIRAGTLEVDGSVGIARRRLAGSRWRPRFTPLISSPTFILYSW